MFGGGINAKRILILDDDNFFLSFTKDLLQAVGYEIKIANNLLDFETDLRKWKPDLILSDIHMPDIQGDKLCTSLKKFFGDDVPIMIVSADGDKIKELEEAQEFDACLNKNDLTARLLPMVETLLRDRRSSDY